VVVSEFSQTIGWIFAMAQQLTSDIFINYVITETKNIDVS